MVSGENGVKHPKKIRTFVRAALRRAPPILANDMFRDHFRAHSDERQLQVFLGQRTGNPGVDLSIDVAVRKFLKAADFRMRDLMGHIFLLRASVQSACAFLILCAVAISGRARSKVLVCLCSVHLRLHCACVDCIK